MKVALVRGKFLNKYEMQSFEPLADSYELTAFGSLNPYFGQFKFPVVKLPSPMDLPDFPYKMPVLNRIFIDAHYLFGLEKALTGYDLVHTAETYYHYTQQALDAKKNGRVKKVIATVLENIPHNNEGIRGRKEFKNRARKQLDHIIALTQLTKKAIVIEGAEPDKITVIGHGIDTKIFMPKPMSRKKQKKINPENITVMFSGRLEYYKGIYDVLAAFENVLKIEGGRFKLKLIFVGEGNELNNLIRLEKKSGIQKFVEHKTAVYQDMPEMYRQADIFIAPSKSIPTYKEQYCTALLEAQSMELPIITTDCGGIPENVKDAALIAHEGDVNQLTGFLLEFVRNSGLRSVYARKARLRAEKVHDISIISSKISKVYDKVMSG